jgi:3-keto-disaccharide hydrolase
MIVHDSRYLAMADRTIDLEQSELLFQDDFASSETREQNWLEVGDAAWAIEDGVLEGKWRDDRELRHGQIFTRKEFSGDILITFDAQTVPPSDHDIIWWWGVKLNQDNRNWEHGYLGAIGGWWSNQAGIEKIEGRSVYMAKTPLFKLEAGKQYKIQCGTAGNTLFFFANGELIMEFVDPKPFTQNTPGRIGFGIYQSHIKFSNLKVYAPNWETRKVTY